MVKKFHDLTSPHLAQSTRDRIVDNVMALDQRPTCHDLMKAVAVVPRK